MWVGHTDVLLKRNCESYALAMRRRRLVGRGWRLEDSGDVPASGGSNPAREMLAAGGQLRDRNTRQIDTYLDANLAQVAQSPCKGRHVGDDGLYALESSPRAGEEVIEAWVEDSRERGKSSAELIYFQALDR